MHAVPGFMNSEYSSGGAVTPLVQALTGGGPASGSGGGGAAVGGGPASGIESSHVPRGRFEETHFSKIAIVASLRRPVGGIGRPFEQPQDTRIPRVEILQREKKRHHVTIRRLHRDKCGLQRGGGRGGAPDAIGFLTSRNRVVRRGITDTCLDGTVRIPRRRIEIHRNTDARRQPSDVGASSRARTRRQGLPLCEPRLEARILFEELLARFSSIELAGEITPLRSTMMNGAVRMPVVLR